jgi:hypothetical protein
VSRKQSEVGSITLWLAITAVALFAAAGLVLDGGEAMGAKSRAVADAYSAARAGADSLDQARLATGAAPSPDPAAATVAARSFLAQAGVDPAGATIAVTGGQVSVTVRISERTRILGVVGVGSITVTGHGTARPVYAVAGGP